MLQVRVSLFYIFRSIVVTFIYSHTDLENALLELAPGMRFQATWFLIFGEKNFLGFPSKKWVNSRNPFVKALHSDLALLKTAFWLNKAGSVWIISGPMLSRSLNKWLEN